MECRRLLASVASLLLLLALPLSALASGPAPFAGRYGHDATASADDVVWIVQAAGAQWRVVLATDGEIAPAQRLLMRGRAAFWARMGWPTDSSADADCLSWGEKPGSLDDLLEDLRADTPPAPPAPGEDHGHAVLCHVPPAARARIDWIADNASDWFYYDPMAGVMEVRRLP